MSVGPNCPNCGGELQASWKVCPLCGTAIANDEPVNAVSPPILGLDNPFADSKERKLESKAWYAETQREGRTDLTHVGIGLIVLGVLGFAGGVTVIFSGSLHRLGTLEGVTICILFGGGLLIAMVVGGTTMIAAGSNKTNSAQNFATGIMGGLLASFMVAGLVVLTIVAAFIYAIEDCLNGCK